MIIAIGVEIGVGNLTGPSNPPVGADWILITSFWDDAGEWKDGEFWID